ncbi:MAG: HAD family phosphatase [Bifidobacteriaceae bacterium]|nr:HAD family phosphatase [Bifidobacteriaceae bacterium]
MEAISDVLFDFAGVLVDWRPELALRGIVPQDVADRFFDTCDPHGFWVLDDLRDAGLPESEVCAVYDAWHEPPLRGMYRTYLDRIGLTIAGMVPGMEALLHDLRAAGVRLWGLTNWSAEDIDAPFSRLPALALLDDTIVSGRERIVKPTPDMYRLAISRFGLDPERTAFFDDKPENVAGAASCGIRAFAFRGADAARDALRQGGVAL